MKNFDYTEPQKSYNRSEERECPAHNSLRLTHKAGHPVAERQTERLNGGIHGRCRSDIRLLLPGRLTGRFAGFGLRGLFRAVLLPVELAVNLFYSVLCALFERFFIFRDNIVIIIFNIYIFKKLRIFLSYVYILFFFNSVVQKRDIAFRGTELFFFFIFSVQICPPPKKRLQNGYKPHILYPLFSPIASLKKKKRIMK